MATTSQASSSHSTGPRIIWLAPDGTAATIPLARPFLVLGARSGDPQNRPAKGFETPHAILATSHGNVYIRALGRKVSVNGQPMRQAELRDGDRVDVGRIKLLFHTDATPRPATCLPAALRTDGDEHPEVKLGSSIFIVGSCPDADLRIPSAAAIHLAIAPVNGRHMIRSLIPGDTLRINGHIARERPLEPGDVIEIVGTQILYKLVGTAPVTAPKPVQVTTAPPPVAKPIATPTESVEPRSRRSWKFAAAIACAILGIAGASVWLLDPGGIRSTRAPVSSPTSALLSNRSDPDAASAIGIETARRAWEAKLLAIDPIRIALYAPEPLRRALDRAQAGTLADSTTHEKVTAYIEAIRLLDEASRAATQNEIIYRLDRAGRCIADGKLEEADEVAVAARRLQPDNPAVRRLLERLKMPRTVGQTWTNTIGMTFAHVPAGEFIMGSELSPDETVRRFAGQTRWYTGEQPQHRVQLSRSFFLGIHEVTCRQFEQFVNETKHTTDAEIKGNGWGMGASGYSELPGITWRSPGYQSGPDHPVTLVSWSDAAAFCRWLSAREQRTYHLPTEAQWEYACRAGGRTVFPWGDEIVGIQRFANVCDQSATRWLDETFHRSFPDAGPWDDGFHAAAPVGKFQPNAWGLYDMIGNAFEWCSDYYGPYPAAPAADPTGPATGPNRVIRGGSWASSARMCRSANRDWLNPASRSSYVGFRVALE